MKKSTPGHDSASLVGDLYALGVRGGDILFIHSSFKSLGPVSGGAETVIRALETAVGPDGLILMPSFNLVKDEDRARTWNIETTPSTVGWLTEYFRRMPGTFRSDHYSHSVAARGKNAEWFVSSHKAKDGWSSPWDLEPWGRTFGTHSPMIRAYRAGGKVLMLGVDYQSSTYMHVVEVRYWNEELARDPNAPYFWIDLPVLGAYWDAMGRLTRGKVGDSDSRLFGIPGFVDTLFNAVKESPQRFFKHWPV